MSSASIPIAPKDEDGDDRWISIHKRFIQECKEKDPDVLFLGDSILEMLQFTDFWNQSLAPLHCLNFSIQRDQTMHVLYRVKNGELENIKPKIVVLHVGTHNVSHNAEEVSEGILEIVKEIRAKHPETYIVLPTLLPRGQFPNPLREKNEKVNVLLKEKCSGLKKLQIVEVDKGLVQQDGSISHHDLFDYLNLTNAGSKKVFEPVWDLLIQILEENQPEPTLTPSE